MARLLTSPALREELRRSFEDGGRFSFNLAPPIFNAGVVNGRPCKREFGVWILPFMTLLKHARGLRGTRLDPFGRTAERRMERLLIVEYESLVNHVLDALSPRNHEQAVALLGMIGEVRGFGPVKEAAVALYRRRVAAAERSFFSRDPPDQSPQSAPAIAADVS